jgi:hypothetical protein
MLTRERVNSFSMQNRDEIVNMDCTPQEHVKRQPSRTFRQDTMRAMTEDIHGCVSQLIVNLEQHSLATE